MIESFWNNFDTINAIRLFAQWAVAIFGILALVFTMRSTTLKNRSDEDKARKDSIEIARLHAKADSATFQSDIAKKDAKYAKEEVATAKSAVALATQEATEAKRRTEPRKLSKEQIQILHEEFERILPFAVKEQNCFMVEGSLMNGESVEYAIQIYEAIKNTKLAPAIGLFKAQTNVFEGISIFLNQPGTKSTCCQMVENAFTKAEIKYVQKKFEANTLGGTDEQPIVHIVIGYK